MIIRARPKFLEGIDICDIGKNKIMSDMLYFNSGRAALKFYLQYLNSKENKKIKIAMQAFNCSVVLDAAIESDCEIFLLDIKLNDFSVSLDDVNKLFKQKEINVLLLTHYQGIPNTEYKEIIDVCKINGVIVIEDLSHGWFSKINGYKIGTLGDVCIYSYSFDKPFTSLYGGALRTKKYDVCLHENYKQIGTETNEEAMLDIKILFFLYE